jgi:uncharacterized protein (TIGR02266 family)
MSEVRVGGWSGVENRKHKRVPLKVAITCRSSERVMQVHSENISSSGLLVRCVDPFPQDSEISVSFTLPDASTFIRLQARVAHVVPGVFMGLEFVEVPAEARAPIERYVASSVPIAKAK